jgi:hypothetical protein
MIELFFFSRSPTGMFLQRRIYPEAYPLKPLRLSLSARVGEDVITGLSLFHDLPQADPTYMVSRTIPPRMDYKVGVGQL